MIIVLVINLVYFYRFDQLTGKQNIVRLNETDVRNAINYNQPKLTEDVPMETSDSSNSSLVNFSSANLSPSLAVSPSPAHLQLDNKP